MARIFYGIALGLIAPVAIAQDADGSRSVLSYGVGFSYDSNPTLALDDIESRTDLTANLGFQTQRQTRDSDLQLGFSTALRSGEDLEDPRLNLGYTYRASRHELSLDGAYQQGAVTDLALALDNTGTPFVFSGEGQRIRSALNAGLTGGIDMPFGYQIRYGIDDVRYEDTISTRFSDTRTERAGLDLRFDLSALSQLSLSYSHVDYEADNTTQTHRQTDRLSAGMSYRIDGITSLEVDLGQSRVRTQSTGADQTRDGSTFDLSLTREDRLGYYRLSLGRDLDASGAHDQLRLERTREFPLGQIRGTLGVDWSEEGDTNWIGSLDYQQSWTDDQVQLNVTRSVRADDNGDSVVLTRLSGGLTHLINDTSSIGFDLAANHSQESGDDLLRADASLSYNRALAEQANLSVGIAAQMSRDGDDDMARSNDVFIRLTRSVDWLH